MLLLFLVLEDGLSSVVSYLGTPETVGRKQLPRLLKASILTCLKPDQEFRKSGAHQVLLFPCLPFTWLVSFLILWQSQNSWTS